MPIAELWAGKPQCFHGASGQWESLLLGRRSWRGLDKTLKDDSSENLNNERMISFRIDTEEMPSLCVVGLGPSLQSFLLRQSLERPLYSWLADHK